MMDEVDTVDIVDLVRPATMSTTSTMSTAFTLICIFAVFVFAVPALASSADQAWIHERYVDGDRTKRLSGDATAFAFCILLFDPVATRGSDTSMR
jgi:hypothetical protein